MIRTRRYRFGELLLSPGQRLLLRGSEPVALPPRCLDLLILLVAERGRVVGRDEIHRRVWGGAAVTDGAFTQAVRTLRRALGDDDPKRPRFIRTAARAGYQFVAAGVAEEDDDAPLAMASDSRPGVHDGGSLALHERISVGGTTTSLRARSPLAVAVAAALGAATGGVVTALFLGTLLVAAGGARWRLLPVLCLLGALVGAWGGGAVGAGMALVRRWREGSVLTLALGGAAGGALAGALAHLLAGWMMSDLLGHAVTALGGAREGFVLGGAVALGAALGRRGNGRGVLAATLAGALAAGVLAAAGARLSGGSLDTIAGALRGTQLIAPLGTYLGEGPQAGEGTARWSERAATTGPATRLAVSLFEGALFGAGVGVGVTLGERRTVSS